MDDLIKMVTDRVGIPQDKARSAVELILGQLKSRLPAPLASQVENALSGGGDGGGGIGSGLGGGTRQPGATDRPTNPRR